MNTPGRPGPRSRRIATLALLALASTSASVVTPRGVAPAPWFAALCAQLAAWPLQQTGVPSAGHAAPRPATRVTIISCTPVPGTPVKSVTTAIVDFPPLAFSGPHRHPGVVTAFVLEGIVRSQMEGGPAIDYTTGQTWVEAPRALHVLAENPDATHAAKLLALFVTDEGCGPLVIPEPS